MCEHLCAYSKLSSRFDERVAEERLDYNLKEHASLNLRMSNFSEKIPSECTVSLRFEERKISKSGWDVLIFGLCSYRTRSCQIGP